MNDRPFVYLACPYSHDERVVRETRFILASRAAAYLASQGHLVFSPVTHGHPMQCNGNTPNRLGFWMRLDLAFLARSHLMVILPLDGWRESLGLRKEIEFASKNNIDILYLDPETFEIDWNGPPPKTKIDRL